MSQRMSERLANAITNVSIQAISGGSLLEKYLLELHKLEEEGEPVMETLESFNSEKVIRLYRVLLNRKEDVKPLCDLLFANMQAIVAHRKNEELVQRKGKRLADISATPESVSLLEREKDLLLWHSKIVHLQLNGHRFSDEVLIIIDDIHEELMEELRDRVDRAEGTFSVTGQARTISRNLASNRFLGSVHLAFDKMRACLPKRLRK